MIQVDAGSAPAPVAKPRSVAAHVEDLALAAMEAAERGDLDETERLARQALSIARRLGGGSRVDALLSRSLRPLATAQRARGQYPEAERTFRRALTSASVAFGSESLEAAELHNDLGMTLKYMGRFAEADAAYGRARAILESVPDVDPEDLAALFHNVGGLAYARGDFETAEPLARRATEIRSRALGERATATLLDRSAHAAILYGLGRIYEAEASIRDLLGDLEAALGSDHPEVAVALNNLAAIRLARGELVEAAALFRRVIEIREFRHGQDSATLAVPLNNLARVLALQGRTAEAAALYDRAIDLLEPSVDEGQPNLLAIRRNAARLSRPG